MSATSVRWVWLPVIVKVVLGSFLIFLGVAAYETFTGRADQRVTNGAAMTGRLTEVVVTRGPDSVTVEYEYGESSYRATARSLFGSASGYSEGAEALVYVDRSDPRSVALSGGFASDGGWWFVVLPAPVAVSGVVVVVLTIVGLFRHRLALSADFEGFEEAATIPPFSTGIRVCGEDIGRWLPAHQRLERQLGGLARCPEDGWHVFVEFWIERKGINGLNPAFRGVRVGPLSRKRGILKLAVVVAADATGSPDQLLRESLARAMVAAERFGERKGAVGSLAGARRALRELPPAGTEPSAPEETLPGPAEFAVGFRGYDVQQVDSIVRQGHQALRSESAELAASTLATVRSRPLRTRLRGYDRQQVDGYLGLLEKTLRRDPPT